MFGRSGMRQLARVCSVAWRALVGAQAALPACGMAARGTHRSCSAVVHRPGVCERALSAALFLQCTLGFVMSASVHAFRRKYQACAGRHGQSGKAVARCGSARSHTLRVASSLADQSCTPSRAPQGAVSGARACACVCVGVRAWLQNVPCMRGHTCEALCTTHSRKCRKSRKPPNPAPWGRPDVQGRTREQAPSSCAPVARLATALSPGCSAELCCHRCQRQPARHATRRGNAPAQIAGSCLLAEIRSYRAGPSGRAISGKP